MLNTLYDRILEWDRYIPLTNLSVSRWNSLVAYLDWIANNFYLEYEPIKTPQSKTLTDYMMRLDAWIDNVNDTIEQQTLLTISGRVMFIGRDAFHSLYRSAYANSIARWLVDIEKIDMYDANSHLLIERELKNTWICPITDSMRINEFYHINNITGRDERPDWRSLAKFSCKKILLKEMRKMQVKRLVLLEDFVGSGSQVQQTVEFAASISNDMEVLIVPLVVCPEGSEYLHSVEAKNQHVTYSPVLELPRREFITLEGGIDDPEEYEQIRGVLESVNKKVNNKSSAQGAYGFRRTGGFVVMYTNCPNNTLPIIGRNNSQWRGLFPRSTRV